MQTSKRKVNITLLSLITTLCVATINTASALVAYQVLIHNRPAIKYTPLISDASSSDETPSLGASQMSSSAGSTSSVDSNSVSSAVAAGAPRVAAKPKIRKATTPIVIGQPAQPAKIIKQPDGTVVYHWCTGTNPALEDGVCEAVLSIASSPVATNPHLSAKAKKSLSLLPRDTSIVMDESSWVETSPTSGTMDVLAKTKAYGDVKLKITLTKSNNIWIVSDGQLA